MLFPVLKYCRGWRGLAIKSGARSPRANKLSGMHCWLCEFSDDPVARSLTHFMTEQAVTMGPELMAERVHEALVESCPMADGIGLEEVRSHIQSHMLQPGVRVACFMRSLLKLSDKLEGITTAYDPETGETVVDGKNVSVYLKVVSEIMQMYRTGEVNRLLFAPPSEGR